jgi:hypothetical protein
MVRMIMVKFMLVVADIQEVTAFLRAGLPKSFENFLKDSAQKGNVCQPHSYHVGRMAFAFQFWVEVWRKEVISYRKNTFQTDTDIEWKRQQISSVV